MIFPYKRPQVILLDLDDTIVSFDSACKPAWTKTCNDFVSNHSVGFTDTDLYDSIQSSGKWYWADHARHKTGRENLRNARRDVVRLALKALHAENECWSVSIADSYTDLHNSMISLLPDAMEALALLAQFSLRLAVVTNGSPAGQREKISRFGLTHFFEHIFIDAEIGYSKPDKRIFQFALDAFGVKPEVVWMVGDNLNWDVFGAQQLGIFAVWNDYKMTGLPNDSTISPDLIVNSVYEMAKIIEKIPT